MPTGSVTPLGGGTTTAQVVASGKVLPVADATGVTVDTTTYDDPFATGKIAALIFPTDQAAFGFAQTGDAFPRFLWESDATLWGGDGTYDPAIAARAGFGPGRHDGFRPYERDLAAFHDHLRGAIDCAACIRYGRTDSYDPRR
jgi:hypothetical protein